ncbi:hypothetical protein [Lentzea fradiae]|uniref:hypothetical protein n=1 Tax=Lentzea fradiae TaxID=200378 RepID=UPI0011600A81|nr:hypothetical protein [Lentzea fradiae]
MSAPVSSVVARCGADQFEEVVAQVVRPPRPGPAGRATEAQDVPFAALGSLKALVDHQVAAGHGTDSLARAVESFEAVAAQRLARG